MHKEIDERINELLWGRHFFAALALAVRELKYQGESFENHSRVAQIEMFLGLIRRAKRSWQGALCFKEGAPAYVGLGTILFREGAIQDAIFAFERSLQLEPANTSALVSLSTAHLYLSDYQTARRYAARTLKLQPNNLEAMLCRARAEIALGNMHLAEDDIAALLQTGYKADEVRLLQVDVLLQNKEFEVVLPLAAALCERYPDSNECLLVFRKAFRKFKQDGAAERFAKFLENLEHYQGLGTPRSRWSRDFDDHSSVDVIIPVHNARSYVEDCVNSVLENSGPMLGKLILVNDASEMETVELLNDLKRADERVVLIHTSKRLGFTDALRLGLSGSFAPCFVALNSDTLVPNRWLKQMYEALKSDPATAMVGPLSNNAVWQNYSRVFGDDGEFYSSEIPPQGLRDNLLTASMCRWDKILIEMPMLHGFCIMVDRPSYDKVGGLDHATFPEGYGEFQDLSIRLRGQGHKLYAVADCIVFHASGASISAGRRATLSRIARRTLYDRYTALSYLCIEMMCCENENLEILRQDYIGVKEQ